MHINELATPSKYLRKEDAPNPILVTVSRVTKENVAKPNDPPKVRGILYFIELEKGMVLNATNLKRAARALNSDDTDAWIDRKLVVYTDPDVEYGGELVGGLRIRAPKNQPTSTRSEPPPAPKRGTFQDIDSDVPF